MAIEKAQGIIIKKNDFRETSLLVSFYTKEFGKIKGLLKAARSELNKFGSRMELFTDNEIVFYRKTKSEYHLISQCDLRKEFSGIKKDLNKIDLACYAVKLVDALVAQEDKNEAVYELLFDFLKELCDSDDILRLEKIFEIKFLSLSGFKPYLDACISCNEKIDKYARFSLKFGGLLCRDCAGNDVNSSDISEGAIASILHYEKNNWEQSLRLKLSKNLDEELDLVLKKFLQYHTGIDIKNNSVVWTGRVR